MFSSYIYSILFSFHSSYDDDLDGDAAAAATAASNLHISNPTAHTKKQLEDYFRDNPKVKIVRAQKREGLIRARLLGARHAKSPVLTYLDSHCECTEGWLEPLLDRIARNSTTVVCPVIDVIDDTTMEYHYRDSGGVNVGGFDWNLQFNWHGVPERERKKHSVSFLLLLFSGLGCSGFWVTLSFDCLRCPINKNSAHQTS